MEQVVVRNVARFAKGHVIVTMCLGIVKKDVKVVGRELTAQRVCFLNHFITVLKQNYLKISSASIITLEIDNNENRLRRYHKQYTFQFNTRW